MRRTLALSLLIVGCRDGVEVIDAGLAIEHITVVDVDAGSSVPQRTVLIAD